MRQPIADRPLLLLGVLLVFIGVQFLTFGLLAELLARTYYESQNKPTYVIREIRQTDGGAGGGALMATIAGTARAARPQRPAHHGHPAGAVRRAPVEGRQVSRPRHRPPRPGRRWSPSSW